MTKLNSIQALRGIAALAVFLCHLIAIEEAHAGRAQKLTDFWINGAHGVDLFFVISGFIMVWVAADLKRGVGAAGAFLYARITRIYPLWWLFAGTMAVFLIIFRGVPWDVVRLEPAGIDGPTHLLKSFLLLPQPEHPVLGVGWTLVHEMYFYLGFALLILLVPRKWRLAGLLAWATAVTMGALAGLTNTFGNTIVELIFYPMTLQFVAGALVGYAIKAGWRRLAAPLAVLGALGLIASFLEFDIALAESLAPALGYDQLPQFGGHWRRTFVYGIPAALLIYGLVALEIERGLGRYIPKLMVSLGDWSYSLYLCHVLVISAVGRVTYGALSPQSPLATGTYLILVTFATILTAALTYQLFERPSIRFFKRLRSGPSRQASENSPAAV